MSQRKYTSLFAESALFKPQFERNSSHPHGPERCFAEEFNKALVAAEERMPCDSTRRFNEALTIQIPSSRVSRCPSKPPPASTNMYFCDTSHDV